VCVPLASPTEPLGTLWVFGTQVRKFTAEQTNLIEIIAGRVVSELQREVLLEECIASKQWERQLARAARWQADRLPNVKPLLDDWQLSGGRGSGDQLGRSFFDWFVARDSSFGVALGSGEGTVLESALTVASLQSLLRAHAQEGHDTAEVLSRVNETFWNLSAGGQFGSLLFARLDTESGALACAQAGAVEAWILGPNGIRRLPAAAVPLGTDPELRPPCWQGRLKRGEVLLAVTCSSQHDTESAPPAYLEILRQHCRQSTDALLSMLTSALAAEHAEKPADDWCALVVKRGAPRPGRSRTSFPS
jgi:hypothetical protein